MTAASPLVRIAEIEVDAARLDDYLAHLKLEIEASIAREAGVLKLYALQDRDQPNLVRMVEIYADDAAYQAHLVTPHFLAYKRDTADMVKSLKLLETDPVLLGEK